MNRPYQVKPADTADSRTGKSNSLKLILSDRTIFLFCHHFKRDSNNIYTFIIIYFFSSLIFVISLCFCLIILYILFNKLCNILILITLFFLGVNIFIINLYYTLYIIRLLLSKSRPC